MSEKLERELGAVLDRYDAVRSAAEVRARHVRDEEGVFLGRFTQLAKSVVRPVFEAAGRILRQRGHDYRIVEDRFATEDDGKTMEASIRLRVAPAGVERALDDERWALAFTTRHYSHTVSVRNGAVPYEGAAGAKGVHPLESIDQPLVEAEVLRLMEALVKR